MSVATHENVTDTGAIRAEFSELVSRCGLFDLAPRAKISLTGSDRVRWLNGMVTNNIRDLAAGHGVYTFLLNPQGHILGDLYAYNRGESLILDTDRAQVAKLLATFDRYIIMDDVEVSDVTDQTAAIAVAGPTAANVLRAAGFGGSPLELLQFIGIKVGDIHATLVRGDFPSTDWFEIWTSPADVDQLRKLLLNSGAKAVSHDALDLFRIAAGVPRYGQDIRERDLPQETEQARALNFSKGCYIGQEIVERIRSRGAVHRKFAGFEVEGPPPSPGAKIQVDGKDVGEITSVATLPIAVERNVALGYIRREIAAPGRKFQAADTTLSVANLPFAGVFQN